MKIAGMLLSILLMVVSAQALTCWVCENARSHDDCLRRGRSRQCQLNQEACQSEVRRGSFGTLITKRCKQAHACANNFMQNLRSANLCNSRIPSAVCRCCCNTDLCNRDSMGCSSAKR